MVKVLRRISLVALAVLMVAAVGCAKKTGDEVPNDEYAESPMTPEEQQAAMQISSGTIYFEYDRFELRSDSKAVLQQKAGVIKQFPALRVLIEGHCDERGTEEYNLALGERRARAAYDFLVNLGVSPSQLEMVSFGKLHPAREGSGESVWSMNRRDEFKVSKPRQ